MSRKSLLLDVLVSFCSITFHRRFLFFTQQYEQALTSAEDRKVEVCSLGDKLIGGRFESRSRDVANKLEKLNKWWKNLENMNKSRFVRLQSVLKNEMKRNADCLCCDLVATGEIAYGSENAAGRTSAASHPGWASFQIEKAERDTACSRPVGEQHERSALVAAGRRRRAHGAGRVQGVRGKRHLANAH